MANVGAPDSWEQQADSDTGNTAASNDMSTKFSTLNVNAMEFVPSFCVKSASNDEETSPTDPALAEDSGPITNGEKSRVKLSFRPFSLRVGYRTVTGIVNTRRSPLERCRELVSRFHEMTDLMTVNLLLSVPIFLLLFSPSLWITLICRYSYCRFDVVEKGLVIRMDSSALIYFIPCISLALLQFLTIYICLII